MRAYCKKSVIHGIYNISIAFFKQGEWYCYEIRHNKVNHLLYYYVGGIMFHVISEAYCFSDYFYTEKEIRLLKLEEIRDEGIM